MDDSAPKSQKIKLGIELEIDGGQRMLGSLFVSNQQRLPDLFKRVDALEEELADAKKSSS